MPKKKKQEALTYGFHGFSEFLAQPTISAALVVFGLIALVLSLMEFGRALY